jgi:1-acyl-sn-glycerol-3-phosphate acyltransferase
MSDSVVLDHSRYASIIERMIANTAEAPEVTEENVYQEGRPANKPLVHEIVRDLMLPGSRIIGKEHLQELHRIAQRKKHCLILMEHYSNFDLPCFIELLERGGEEGRNAANDVVAVAGVKLNEESPLVFAFTEVYTRVVLFPARSLEAIPDPEQRRKAEKRRARINLAAMKKLMALRKEGKMILVFPSGTRYRPWDPSTARGLKEIDTYLKFYSHMVTVAVNGNTLVPNPHGNMGEDFPVRDIMIYTVSPVQKCSEFRRRALKGREHLEDSKQHVADSVMATLARQHARTESARQRLFRETGSGPAGSA